MLKGKASLLFWLAALLLVPGPAFAFANLTCSGASPSGDLYDLTGTCQGITGLQDIFSGLVCDYVTMLNDIMSRVYCGFQSALVPPLKAAMALYIAVFGVQILFGMTEVSIREFMTRLIRLAVIYTFATQAAFGIGVAFNFFISATNMGIYWMLSAAMPGAPGGNPMCTLNMAGGMNPERQAFAYMDYLICDALTGPFSQQKAKVTGFVAILSFIIFPVFMMFIYFTLKTLAIFIRALLSYMIAVSAIAFLITLSPMFLALGLFRTTYRFFDDWLRFMISFSLQVILIFGGVAMWMYVLMQIGNFFTVLEDVLVEVKDIVMINSVQSEVDTWGVCLHDWQADPNLFSGEKPVCSDGMKIQEVCNLKFDADPTTDEDNADDGDLEAPNIKPTVLPKCIKFINFLIMNLLALCVVVYIFDTLITHMPALARQLAGPAYSPQITGGLESPINFGKGAFSPEFAAQNSQKYAGQIQNLLGVRDKK